jgi:nucleotide-binding universal stress UspA family protein
MEAAAASLKSAGGAAQVVVARLTKALETIIEVADKEQADLLVIGVKPLSV